MARKKKPEDRVALFLDLVGRENIRHLRNEDISNGDILNFYQYKGIMFIVHAFRATGGFEVYVSAPGNKTQFAVAFIKKVEELRVDLDMPSKTPINEAEALRELNRLMSRALLGKDPYQ